MVLKLSELRVVAFAEFVKESKKSIVTLWHWVPKSYFSQYNQVVITLS